jgi:hypothetical protein
LPNLSQDLSALQDELSVVNSQIYSALPKMGDDPRPNPTLRHDAYRLLTNESLKMLHSPRLRSFTPLRSNSQSPIASRNWSKPEPRENFYPKRESRMFRE